MSSQNYATRREAEHLLSQPLPLTLWANAGLIPTDEAGRLNVKFIQRLVQFIGDRQPSRERAYLCMLEWRLAKQPELQDEIAAIVKELLTTPKFLIRQEAARILGYHRTTILRWARVGFLPSVMLASKARPAKMTIVFLRDDVMYVKEILDRLTSYEVANILGLNHSHVIELARLGRLPATAIPGGLRFKPEDVSAYLTARDHTGFTLAEIVKLTGVTEKIARGWMAAGRITLIGKKRGKQPLYDRAGVLQMKTETGKLRGNFDWLPATIHDATYPQKTVARKLGISADAVGVWTRANLLPHFDLGAPEAQIRQSRLYVASYVDDLVRFIPINGLENRKEAARIFKKQMHARHT